MTATDETDVPLDTEPETGLRGRTPHVLMTIAGAIGLTAAVILTVDKSPKDATANLMDAGGANFQNLVGVGPDNVGGTADDLDVDFGDDVFSAAEGFVGIEDTLGRIVFGVTS